jgi:hypothetical protein
MVKCSMCTTTDYRQNVLKFNGLLDYKLLYLTTKCPIVTVKRASAMRKNSALSRVLPEGNICKSPNPDTRDFASSGPDAPCELDSVGISPADEFLDAAISCGIYDPDTVITRVQLFE